MFDAAQGHLLAVVNGRHTEIVVEEWIEVFEHISKLRYKWNVKVEVFSSDFGSQVLIDRLPLNGITIEKKSEYVTVDLSVGDSPKTHQTHSIRDPLRISYIGNGPCHGGIVSIEQYDGTKTLIHFLEPKGLLLGFKEKAMAAAA